MDHMKNLKVMTYNIWNGFELLERRESFVRFIREEKPDILALQELCGYTDEKLSELAKEYEHVHSILLKEDGYPVGITSKHPIKLIRKVIDGYWHGWIHVKILDADYIVVHLSPSDESYRMREMRNIVEYVKKATLENCIILGDFNAQSPEDQGVMSDGTISGFLNNGFHDTFFSGEEERSYSFPTSILGNSACRGERIDFQLVSDECKKRVIKSTIIKNQKTESISDHYPLLVEYS